MLEIQQFEYLWDFEAASDFVAPSVYISTPSLSTGRATPWCCNNRPCRKLSSAMSGAKAACDHMRDWFCGTQENNWASLGVVSDGSYNIPEGIVYSFPCSVDPTTKEWKIVEALDIDDFSRNKMDITLNELIEERDEALAACQ